MGLLEDLLAQYTALPQNSVGDGSMIGNLLSLAENAMGVNQQQGGNCGTRYLRVPSSMAMGLYKQGCNRKFIPRRIFVDGPDGVPHVLYNAGPATIGAREKSVAKSIARRMGMKLCRPGTGTRRRRPR